MAWPYDRPSFWGVGFAGLYFSGKTGNMWTTYGVWNMVGVLLYMFSWWFVQVNGWADLWYMLSKSLILFIACAIGFSVYLPNTILYTGYRKLFSVPLWIWKHTFTSWPHTLLVCVACFFAIVVLVIYEWTWWWLWPWMEVMVVVLMTVCDVVSVFFLNGMKIGGQNSKLASQTEGYKNKVKRGFQFQTIMLWIVYMAYWAPLFFRFVPSLLGTNGEDFWVVMICLGFAAVVSIFLLFFQIAYHTWSKQKPSQENLFMGGLKPGGI